MTKTARPAERRAPDEDPGVLVGHSTDLPGATGCTVVLCPDGATGGVAVRGGAPCTRETDIFRTGAGVDPRRVHGVLLTGGSVFGLAAADGVVRFLAEKGIGLRTPHACIPILAAAGLYDLGIGSPEARPTPESGYAACVAATVRPVAEGSVGAGTGATVGKAAGMERCTKGGIGIATERLPDGTVLSAVVAVNAFGEIVDPRSGEIVAGVRRLRGGGFQPISRVLRSFGTARVPLSNTTIGVVVTTATLSKEEANEIAGVAHDGLAQTIRPAHTRVDGDTLFTLATGRDAHPERSMLDMVRLGSAATRVVAAATLRGVRAATGVDTIPAASEIV